MIHLKPVKLDSDYSEKWNNNQHDFVHLYKDGIKVSDTLYRVGGFGAKLEDDYFMLLKHVEAFYEDNITKIKKDKPHLESQWCIIDKNGIEKVNFKSFKTPYLPGGVVYSLESNYYNIETGEFYCYSSTSMESQDFVFLHNRYDKDEARRGVMKINKHDGSFELFADEPRKITTPTINAGNSAFLIKQFQGMSFVREATSLLYKDMKKKKRT